MKNQSAFLFALLLFSCASLSAQFNVAVHFEVHGPLMTQETSSGILVESGPTGQVRTSNEFAYSYGAGRAYGTSVAYRFKQNFLLGLDMRVLDGKPQVQTLTNSRNITVAESQGHTLRIGAFLQNLIILNKAQNLAIYNRVGAHYTTNNEVIVRRNIISLALAGLNENTEFVYSGGHGHSITAGLGIRYGKRKDIYFELGIKGVFQKYRPERRDIVRFTIGDDNVLPLQSTYSRTVVYEPSYVQYSFAPTPLNEPRKSLPISFPFSSLGIEFCMGFEF